MNTFDAGPVATAVAAAGVANHVAASAAGAARAGAVRAGAAVAAAVVAAAEAAALNDNVKQKLVLLLRLSTVFLMDFCRYGGFKHERGTNWVCSIGEGRQNNSV